MAAVTICNDFGAPKNKVWHCFHCFRIYFPCLNDQLILQVQLYLGFGNQKYSIIDHSNMSHFVYFRCSSSLNLKGNFSVLKKLIYLVLSSFTCCQKLMICPVPPSFSIFPFISGLSNAWLIYRNSTISSTMFRSIINCI